MAQHFQYINKLKGKIAASSLRMEEAADRNLVLEMAIKCADLNNPTKPVEQCKTWAYKVMQEFFTQGDLERKMGIPVSKFMDREDTNIPRCQIGFIDILVTPLFDVWSHCIQTPFSRTCIENIGLNRAYWDALSLTPDLVPTFLDVKESPEEHMELKKLNEYLFQADKPQRSSRGSSFVSQSNPSMVVGLGLNRTFNRSGVVSPTVNVLTRNNSHRQNGMPSPPPSTRVDGAPVSSPLSASGSGGSGQILRSSMGKLPDLSKKILNLDSNASLNASTDGTSKRSSLADGFRDSQGSISRSQSDK
jgi:hypothetical protein